MATATKTDKPKTTPAERFRQLAEARASKALIGIRQLSHLANVNSYEYTDDQIDKIEQALRTETDRTIQALRSRKAPAAASFTL